MRKHQEKDRQNRHSFSILLWNVQVDLIRYQRLHINTFHTVKPQSLEHGLIVETVQVDGLCIIGKVLVLVPCGHAEGVALLPHKLFAVNNRVTCALYDMVDGRRSLADCRGCSSFVHALC